MKNIFSSRLSRVKRLSGHGGKPNPADGVPPRRSTGWKRTLLLVLIPVSLAFVAAVEHSNPAISKVIRRKIIAALKNPLTLLDERSPGGRGPRVLLSIKAPHERVLSAAREREPPLPPADNPAFAPDAVASIPIIPAEFDTLPQDQTGTPPPFLPFFPFGPPGNPITPISTPTPNPPTPDSPTSNPPTQPPGTPQTPPGTTVLPEPASWAMMILGLFAIGAAVRRRARK